MTIDVEALAQQLARDPAQRAALREALLGEDGAWSVRIDHHLSELTAIVRDLAAAQARTEARQARTEARLEELAVAQANTETRLNELIGVVKTMNDRIGKLDGDMFEMRSRDRGVAYFAPIARRLQLVEGTRLSAMVDDAVQDGRISDKDADAILWSDAVFSGRHQGTQVHLVVEASVTLNYNDVHRARRRADLLAEVVATPVMAVVHGEFAPRGVAEAAQQEKVWQVAGRRVIAPSDELDEY